MQPLVATVLKDRILLGDGRSVVDPEEVVPLLLRGLQPSDILITDDTWDVREYNLRADIPLKVFDHNTETKLNVDTWLIPPEYLSLDLRNYFLNLISGVDDDDIIQVRVENELLEVERRGFENGLRTIIYVVDTFKKNGQVWGVGRGSSCASYLLYLIGLHCVDCIKYDIHWSEFYHD